MMLPVLLLSILTLVVAQNPYPITGVKANSANVPFRRNIDEFGTQGGPQWDLYIRSLMAMQNASSSDQLSYFQISGIHGKPFIEWNKGGGKKTNQWQGYCPHGEELFLPWHRAYILLFEQVLVDHARRIAKEYPPRYQPDYIQAAETLRAPYWDWASNSNVPDATIPEKLPIYVPNGNGIRLEQVNNPLYTYRFPKEALQGKYGPFDSQKKDRMYRCTSPRRYPDTADTNMRNRLYKQRTYDAFTYSNTFSQFSSTRQNGVSLEQIHNGVHWDAGCGGQFLNSEFSAFEPIFMLHHCNVDRLWAYWQVMRPAEATFKRTYTGQSRYSTPGGTDITPKSPLYPFYRTPQEFHTTESVNSIKGLGYSYEGLEYWRQSQDEMGRNARTLVNERYGSSPPRSRLRRRGETDTRYFVTVELEVTQVERPCSVDVYVGEKLAGSFVVMAQPPNGTIHGSFAIDKAVEEKGMHHLAADEAVKKIEEAMAVKIVKGSDGREILADSVPSLVVELEDVKVVPPKTNDQLPKYTQSRKRPAFGRMKYKANGCE